jgi:hypothetical protein
LPETCKDGSREGADVSGHPHSPARPNPSAIDFDRTPFVAIRETTRACDLACRHCRAEAIPTGDPAELTTEEGFALLDELHAMGTPICVLSGGDPAKRPDLIKLVRHGARTGMQIATIPAATPLLDRNLVVALKEAGLAQMARFLDGPDAAAHDAFRLEDPPVGSLPVGPDEEAVSVEGGPESSVEIVDHREGREVALARFTSIRGHKRSSGVDASPSRWNSRWRRWRELTTGATGVARHLASPPPPPAPV